MNRRGFLVSILAACAAIGLPLKIAQRKYVTWKMYTTAVVLNEGWLARTGGVTLPVCDLGREIYIINCEHAPLKIYPPNVTLLSGQSAQFVNGHRI